MDSIDTRNEAYLDIVKGKGITESQEVIYRVLFHYPDSSDREISEFANIEKNVVTARRNELVEKGMVYISGTKHDLVTGKNVTTWRVNLGEYKPKAFTGLSSTQFNHLKDLVCKANEFQKNKIKEMLD